MKLLQGRIVDDMGKSCTAVYNNDDTDYTITYNPVHTLGISKDDLFRLQMQYPDIYEKFVTVSESRRFYVKKTPKKAAWKENLWQDVIFITINTTLLRTNNGNHIDFVADMAKQMKVITFDDIIEKV